MTIFTILCEQDYDPNCLPSSYILTMSPVGKRWRNLAGGDARCSAPGGGEFTYMDVRIAYFYVVLSSQSCDQKRSDIIPHLNVSYMIGI